MIHDGSFGGSILLWPPAGASVGASIRCVCQRKSAAHRRSAFDGAGIASAGSRRGAPPTGDNCGVSSRLRAIADETVRIVESGWYRAPCGGEVLLAGEVAAAVAGTCLYLPDDAVSAAAPIVARACRGGDRRDDAGRRGPSRR
jgi:hypothetical protein